MLYNTRIAPSPTGYFHLGTARTAYFNWLAARASGGQFILRIDDTDTERNDESMVQVIFDAMNWLGLDYDSTFRQSSRIARYQDAAEQLLSQKRAYLKDGAVWLDYIPKTRSIDDLTGIKISAPGTEHVVLIKSNGLPSYHFASVVDDIDCKINLVLRGSDHVANTIRQVAIHEALDTPHPFYAHVGLIHGMNGYKLSKSAGAKSLLDYRDEGIHPEAMLSFLLRLGWGPKKDDKSTAVLDRERALELFLKGGNLRNQSAKADFAKLAYLNRRISHAHASSQVDSDAGSCRC